MEYIDGITLRELMAQRRPELSEAIDLTIQVGTALVAAHAAGIIHRDIKPENIMIRNDGYVKVLDFGLAKLTERLEEDSDPQSTAKTNVVNTEPGMMMGTPAYMSPEQARGLEVDGRTDIWSLGVMFYELITGWTPFHGSTHMDVIAGILKEEPTPIAEHIQDIPPCLEKVLRKMLSKNKDERYLSGAAMVADLERLKRDMRIQPSGEGRNDLRTGLRPNTWNAQSLRWSLGKLTLYH